MLMLGNRYKLEQSWANWDTYDIGICVKEMKSGKLQRPTEAGKQSRPTVSQNRTRVGG